MGCGSSTRAEVHPHSANGNSAPSNQTEKPLNQSGGSKIPAKSEENNKSASKGNEAEAQVNGELPFMSTDEHFIIQKVLGEGASCKVVSVKEKNPPHGEFAMKILTKSKSNLRQLFETEVKILNLLHNKNVLQFVNAYQDKLTWHIITILYKGGELFDRVRHGHFSESVAAKLTRQMINALHYCHQQHVVHRDIKPENFVFESLGEDSDMKLIDFGCARIVQDNAVVFDVAGSPYYCAPEILSDRAVRTGAVWKASDMWSIGVIVFLLVCGYPPFNGENQETIFRRIKRGKFSFPTNPKHQLSESVKELITNLLQMDPSKRLTAEQALNHEWVVGRSAPSSLMDIGVISSLTAFRSQCRLKKAVARVLSNRMTEDDKMALNKVFNQFDKNGDGQLGPDEIKKLMMHIQKGEEGSIENLINNMDNDHSGGVDIQEFAQGIKMAELNQNKNMAEDTFKLFDVDGDGFVTLKEIEKICDFLSHDAARDLIAEVDKNGDGKIGLEEWIHAMKDIDNRIIKKTYTIQNNIDNKNSNNNNDNNNNNNNNTTK